MASRAGPVPTGSGGGCSEDVVEGDILGLEGRDWGEGEGSNIPGFGQRIRHIDPPLLTGPGRRRNVRAFRMALDPFELDVFGEGSPTRHDGSRPRFQE